MNRLLPSGPSVTFPAGVLLAPLVEGKELLLCDPKALGKEATNSKIHHIDRIQWS